MRKVFFPIELNPEYYQVLYGVSYFIWRYSYDTIILRIKEDSMIIKWEINEKYFDEKIKI